MKKKLVSFLLAVSMTLTLAGCGGSGGKQENSAQDTAQTEKEQEQESASADSDKPYAGQKVVVYTRNVDFEGWQPFVDLVAEKTGIIVEGVVAPTNYPDVATKLSSILTAGDDTFDIVHVDELLGVTYSTAGYLEPINEVIEAEKENYPADVLERISKNADGNYYLLPQELNAMYMFVNKDVMEEAGISAPTNKEEFLEAAKAMTKGDTYGYGAKADSCLMI